MQQKDKMADVSRFPSPYDGHLIQIMRGGWVISKQKKFAN